MKLPKLPESDKPRTFRESLYSMTPVVLTVIATVLAGLSSGEMTRSQYFRAMAAQNQAKASDQWGYFQAKRLRAVQAEDTLDVLNATAEPGRLDSGVVLAASKQLIDSLNPPPTGNEGPPPEREALAARAAVLDAQLHSVLADAKVLPFASVQTAPPSVTDQAIADPNILAAMKAVDEQQSEAQMAPLLRQISDEKMADASNIVDGNLEKFDAALKPMGKTLDQLHAIFSEESELARQWSPLEPQPVSQQNTTAVFEAVVDSALTNVSAARQRYAAALAGGDAKYNQMGGQLCEIQVHMSGISSDRYRKRSGDFFYGMLAAQAGVVISTLTLAVHRRSIFWTLAASAGAIAVAFSGYIYLFT